MYPQLIYLIIALTGRTLSNIVIEPSVSETEQLYNGSYVVLCHGHDTFNTTWQGPDGNIIKNNHGRIHIEETMVEFEHHSLLVFQKIISSDKGEYTCSANVRGEIQQASFTMSVVQRLHFNEPSRHQKLIEGHDMIVICDAHGDPIPNVTWYFNDKPIYKKRGDKPRWPQSWSVRENQAYGYIGGMTNITCQAEGNPRPGYAWTKGNRTLDFTYANVIQEDKRSILQVKLFSKRSLGKYECMADNGIGRIWKTFLLREGRKPETPYRMRVVAVSRDMAQFAIDASNEKTAIGFRFEFVKVPNLDFPPSWIYPEFQDISITDERYTVVDLRPNTNYKIRVATKSNAGLSDFTEDIGFTTSKGLGMSSPFSLIISSIILGKFCNILHTDSRMW